MAITISGENNNDRILASDGVIDSVSGLNIAGIITASSFTGDVTGNLTGNVTGNVNNTSPLLLQTGGFERIRITGDNAIGIAGANYGSSGQVLTSGGSGSAVTWSAIPAQATIANNADNRVITGGSGVNLNGESNLTFDGTHLVVSPTSASNTIRTKIRASSANDDAKLGIYFGNTEIAALFGKWSGSAFSTGLNIPYEPFVVTGASGATRIQIDSSGRVMIGTTTAPNNANTDDFTLATGGSTGFTIRSGTSHDGQIAFSDGTSGADEYRGQVLYNHGGNYMRFLTDAVERLRINSSGKVIIGDLNSDAQLGVYRSSYNIAEFCNTNADATGAEVALRKDSSSPADGDTLGILKFIGDNDAGEKLSYAYVLSKSSDVSDGTEDGRLEFHTRADGTIAERVRIASDGDVTITSTDAGTTGPTLKLFHNSASPAANDVVSRISMFGDDAAGNETEYGRIETVIDDTTNGQETGHINFAPIGYSVNNTVFRIKRRGSASAPSYTTDDADGIILDVYNTGNPYPRYMNFIAKSSGNTDSNIGFWTEAVGGSPTEKLRINSTGEVSIGTVTGGKTLTLYGASSSSFRISKSGVLAYDHTFDGSTYTIANNNGSAGIPIVIGTKTGGGESLRITSSGDVGIGYNSPTVKLHVRESASGASSYDNRYHMICENNGEAYLGFYVPDNQYAGIRFNDTTGLEGTIDYYFSDDEMHFHSSAKHIFKTGGAERLRINSAGRVGINEDSPDRDLHISNATPYIRVESTSANQPATLELYHTRGNGSDKWPSSVSTADGAITFNVATGNNGAPQEKVRINNAGLTTLKNFNGTGFKLEGSGSDYQGMQLQVTDASASQTRNVFIDAVNETGVAVANQVGQIQSDGGSHWSWSTQAAGNRSDRREERLRIQSDGNVLITGNSANLDFKTTSAYSGNAVRFFDSGSSSPDGRMQYEHSTNAILFETGGSWRVRLESGQLRPETDNVYDLGTASHRFRNLYTTDLQLSNKGKTNDVDGTWGDWTLQEGEHKIYMINNRTGKKYSLKMEEE